MISSFAQRVHGPLEAPLARYTRAVTLAWSSFFVLMAVLSLILFFAAPIATWSAFANLLTPFLIGAMFLGEYLLRLRCLPPHLHTGLLASIRAVLAGPTPDPH